ncbi:MAG: response regulator [Magnetococcales bacterium]|nr:response regulator [Magnetococcales bacterium]
MNILIADDELASRRLLEGILSPVGSCQVVENGREAVDQVVSFFEQGKRFDLICLDIMMPEMNGQEALSAIRKFEKENGVIPQDESVIIMITALSSLQTVVESFEGGGCSAYLTKPVTKKALLEKLQNYGLV